MMSKVIFEKNGRIGQISSNRPEKLNSIDDKVPDRPQRWQCDIMAKIK